MEIQGIIHDVLALQTGTGRNGEWKKQEFILETFGQYPKKICIALWGDKIQESLLQKDNKVTVQFDIESREYNGRWFTEAKAWKIELTNASASNSGSDSVQAPISNDIPLPNSNDFIMPQQTDEELPF